MSYGQAGSPRGGRLHVMLTGVAAAAPMARRLLLLLLLLLEDERDDDGDEHGDDGLGGRVHGDVDVDAAAR